VKSGSIICVASSPMNHCATARKIAGLMKPENGSADHDESRDEKGAQQEGVDSHRQTLPPGK